MKNFEEFKKENSMQIVLNEKKNSKKLLDLIEKYGECGKIKYYNWYIKIKYNRSLRYDEEYYILKYGKTEGPKKLKELKEKTSGSKETFIKRYGEYEGVKKYNEFRNKCSIYNQSPQSRIKYRKRKNVLSFQYFLDKSNGDYEKAVELQKDRQNTSSLKSFTKRYGESEGLQKYNECNESKKLTIEKFIERYGESEGLQKYNNFIWKCSKEYKINYYVDLYGESDGLDIYNKINDSKGITLEKLTEKYGENEGIRKYKKWHSHIVNNLKRTQKYSQLEINFLSKLYEKIQMRFDHIYYGDNQYMFFLNDPVYKVAIVDFYIKDINTVIEIYGDYWHMNPKFHNEHSYNSLMNKTAKHIWMFDNNRIQMIKDKYNCNVIIIWEEEIKNNKTILKEILEIINGIR